MIKAPLLRFLLLLPTGVLWVGSTWLLADSTLRTVVVLVTSTVFTALYLRLLFKQVRTLFTAAPHLRMALAKTLGDLTVFVSAFALAFAGLGMQDNTLPGAPISHQLPQALYLSVATFTTLGYGDFAPLGVGRALAAIEALTGYVVLAVVASTAASLLSPYQKPLLERRDDEHDAS